MKFWLYKANCGNTDITGCVDLFWLKVGLRITHEQQIDFLRRLYKKKFPFSERTTSIVKQIMITEDTLDYQVSAKSGWSDEEKRIVG